jgi:tRNA-dihydrouridine synthase B
MIAIKHRQNSGESAFSRAMPESLQIGDVTIPGRVLTAPMTGVSDLPFRRAASACGAPYVATEMVACDSFARGRPDVVRRAAVGEGLPLMVIQLVGRTPEWVAKGAKLAEQAGADIIDFNMGCPCKEVTGALSGSALMREPELAMRLVGAVVNATTRPVTVKMRLGWDDASRNAPELAASFEKLGVKALTVHGRTRQQFYNGVADWKAVAEVKAATVLPVIVNGDITDAASARAALDASGADAVMVARGAYGRPWVAAAIGAALAGDGAMAEPSPAQRLGIALDHLRDTLRFYGDALGLKIFRKHLGWYVEQALCPSDPKLRRAVKAHMCQIDNARAVESELTSLWSDSALPIRSAAIM